MLKTREITKKKKKTKTAITRTNLEETKNVTKHQSVKKQVNSGCKMNSGWRHEQCAHEGILQVAKLCFRNPVKFLLCSIFFCSLLLFPSGF